MFRQVARKNHVIQFFEFIWVVQLVPGPGWMQFIAGFLLLDLSFYYWHIANHKIPILWRFHNVHHFDPGLNVSTGFRFHFGEVLLSTVFRVTQVSLIGMSFATFAAYELVFQANTLFHHSNLRLPIRFERLLNKMLVTPRMPVDIQEAPCGRAIGPMYSCATTT